LKAIETALGYGISIWSRLSTISSVDDLPLVDFRFLLEEHIQSLFHLCKLKNLINPSTSEILHDLLHFYQADELRPNTRGGTLRSNLFQQTVLATQRKLTTPKNYYERLEFQFDDPEDNDYSPPEPVAVRTMGNPLIEKPPNQVIQASFPEDLDLSELTTSIVNQQIADAVMEGGDEDPNTTPLPSSPPRTTTVMTIDTPTPVRLHINLIRHKFATSTDQTMLQLFKSFALAARKTDSRLIILPIDSSKQDLPSLTSQKQIEALTPNQLRLYFASWFREQHYSLSGFLHLCTTLDID